MMGLSGIASLTAGVFFLLGTEAQVLSRGNCPQKLVIKNFSWSWYLGKWYEQERYYNYYEEMGRCWQGEYFLNPSTGGISAIIRFRDHVLNKGQEIEIDVFAKDPYYAPSHFTYTIPGIPYFEDNFQVIATDYVTYAIEYSCKNVPPLGHVEFAWILTRSPYPSYDVIYRAKECMERFGIDTRYLQQVSKGC